MRRLIGGGGGSSQSTIKPKKTVTFARDPATPNKVLCNYHGGNDRHFTIQGSPRNVNQVWFRSSEYKIFKQEARQVIERDGGVSICKRQYKALHSACRSADGTAGVLLLWQAAALCSSNHRGLETLLFPKNTLRHRAIQDVLDGQKKIQARLQQENDNRAPDHDAAAQSLAELSRSITLAARRMARLMAAGDEYVASEKPKVQWENIAEEDPAELVDSWHD